MPVNVLAPSDISASSSDFQPAGTAAPGTTGRVADAGHVHPATAPALGYQIVTQAFTVGSVASGTVNAPAGYKVVGGGFSLDAGELYMKTNAPLADGSGWTVYGTFPVGGGATLTVYAICVHA